MAEKPPKKTVALAIKRERINPPKIFVATGFKLRFDKASGLLDILLGTASQRGERITFDPVIMGSNLNNQKRYVAEVDSQEDNSTQKDDLSVGENASFANIIHFSRMADRAETIFGVFSISDWVEATRQEAPATPEIKSHDSLVVMSTTGFQKKLLLELVLLLNSLEKK